jgi:3-hydroxyisobutyrate dehydrogenase-like beta-hydroxyacid dehydrogenase
MAALLRDRVALIGVGAMGRALLVRLRAAGNEVQAYDVAPAALQAARDGGAAMAVSPAEAARNASYVHVMVASDDDTTQAMLGPDGVLAGATPGTLVFLHGTLLPATTQRIAAIAANNNVDVLDAPITAVPKRLEQGEAAFMVGGPQVLVDKARGYLLQLGDAVHYYGPLGAGNVAKIARALINAGERVVIAEALAILEAGGVDPRQFLQIESAADRPSKLSLWEDIFIIEDGHARHRPATNLFNKDILLAAELADGYRLDAPLTQGAARTAKRWVKEWADLPGRDKAGK